MKSILTVFAAALLLLFVRPVLAGDEGKVIVTISAGPETNFLDYFLAFHSKDGEHSDYFHYGQHGLFFLTTPDFNDAQSNGVVKVLDLAPGEWEIDGFTIVEHGSEITPSQKFAVPFTVKAGETIYIGDYRVHVGYPSDDPDAASVFFSVSDQSARDIPIAQKDDDDVKNVEVAIPVVAPHTPYFSPLLRESQPSVGDTGTESNKSSHP